MKKSSKIFWGIIFFIGIIIGEMSLFMRHQINQTYKRLDKVATVDLKDVEDENYEEIARLMRKGAAMDSPEVQERII